MLLYGQKRILTTAKLFCKAQCVKSTQVIKLFYFIFNEYIFIVALFDCRQNLQKLINVINRN
jgi:hypothetical protein